MASDNTKIQYNNVFNRLKKKANTTDIEMLYNYVMNTKLKDNSKMTYLNVILSSTDKNKLNENELNTYNKILSSRDNFQKKINKSRSVCNLTDKQKEILNKINIKDIDNAIDLLYKSIKEKTNEEDENIYIKYILMSLLRQFLFRNDLRDLLILTSKKEFDKSDKNVLYKPKNKQSNIIIKLVQYKTAKLYGPQVVEVDKNTSEIIHEYLNKYGKNNKYLFESNGKPLSTSNMTHKISSIFQSVTGQPVTSTIMRKLYMSDRYQAFMKCMKKDASKLMHSIDTAKNVYVNNALP